MTLEREIESRTGYETRVTILGHVQRGGTPVAFDRVLATRFGVAAMDAVAAGRFGTMVALRGTEIVEVPLQTALRSPSCSIPRSTRRPSCSSGKRHARDDLRAHRNRRSRMDRPRRCLDTESETTAYSPPPKAPTYLAGSLVKQWPRMAHAWT